MSSVNDIIKDRLFELSDPSYKDFQSKLIPTLSPEVFIGVRSPQLRRYAKELSGTPQASEFLLSLPHEYYDENNLHGFLIEFTGDFDTAISQVENYLPYIDNWASCDCFSPPVFRQNLPALREKIRVWLSSEKTYTIRFAIGMLMKFFLDSAYDAEVPELVASVRSEEYYVRMMSAWFFATALAKRYDEALPYISERRLDTWTHNKAIQKALESYRISPEKKDLLRAQKIKRK